MSISDDFYLVIKDKSPKKSENRKINPLPPAEPKELSLTLDITEEIAVVSYEPDDEVKEKKNITLTTEVIPFYLEKLDAIAAENGGHLALGRVSSFFLYLQFSQSIYLNEYFGQILHSIAFSYVLVNLG